MNNSKIKKGRGMKPSTSKVERRPPSKRIAEKKSSDPSAKKFSFIQPETVTSIADSIGIPELTEDIRNSLAEDASYKLREIIQNCCIALRNNKRHKLLTSDVTRAFEIANVPPVYGHSASHHVDYIHIPECVPDVFVTNDVEVDIVKMVLSKTEYVKSGEEYIKGTWLLPDPPIEKVPESQSASTALSSKDTKPIVVPSSMESSSSAKLEPGVSHPHPQHQPQPQHHPQPQPQHQHHPQPQPQHQHHPQPQPTPQHQPQPQPTPQHQPQPQHQHHPQPQPQHQQKPVTKHEEQTIVSKPPPHFINYYLQVARVVIGGSEPHLKIALEDLKRNPKIGPLSPYFLNLVALTVNKLQRHHRLTDALLRTIEALVYNQFVDPSSHLAVNRAVNALLVIAIEPKIATKCDDLLLRKRAAVLLYKVLICWSIELKQQMDIVRRLLQLLLDANISLKSHYGAIVTLITLGNETLDSYFWPIIDRYFPLLQEKQRSGTNQDILFVHGAIMMAAEKMFHKIKTLDLTTEEIKRFQKVDEKLYEYFGDALVPRRLGFRPRKLSRPRKTPITMADIDHQHSVRNDSVFNEFDSGVRRCITLTMIPRHLQMTYNLNFLNTHSQNNMNSKFKLNICDIFSIPEHNEKNKEILFNFVGSNQLSCEYIRKRHLDSSQLYFHQTSRFSQLCLRQNLFKNTRCIKYCSPSHKKSSAGDLFRVL